METRSGVAAAALKPLPILAGWLRCISDRSALRAIASHPSPVFRVIE
jgi:hypothetical protein